MTDLTAILARLDPEGKLERVREYMSITHLAITLTSVRRFQEASDAALAELLEAVEAKDIAVEGAKAAIIDLSQRAGQAEAEVERLAVDRLGWADTCVKAENRAKKAEAEVERLKGMLWLVAMRWAQDENGAEVWLAALAARYEKEQG